LLWCAESSQVARLLAVPDGGKEVLAVDIDSSWETMFFGLISISQILAVVGFRKVGKPAISSYVIEMLNQPCLLAMGKKPNVLVQKPMLAFD
jgi:hypothetical protein